MITAKEMLKAQKKARDNKELPSTLKEIFENYVDNIFKTIIREPENYYEKENYIFNENSNYLNKYGIQINIKNIADEYNIPWEYFHNFMYCIDSCVSKYKDNGYVVEIYPYYGPVYLEDVKIYILWQDPKSIKK